MVTFYGSINVYTFFDSPGIVALSSVVQPPVTGIFAGDLRYFYHTNSATNQLVLRSFNSSLKISENGLSYYNMIAAQVSVVICNQNLDFFS